MMADDTENVFKILVATDNHVGYLEKDQVRGGDSLEAFEEVLRIAQQQQVDFILLGGDLFHDNKPSRQVLTRTMELLRHYCMGERPCPIEFRSDQAVNFNHSKFPVVNYEDPNYNISIPVFSIHGNHDDPAGTGNLSAMDILSVANMVNYFGKAANVEAIVVSPLLLQKGSSRLALYGLGSCRDERLHRMMRRKQVTFLRPEGEGEEEEGGADEWFSMLVLHQNRAKHGLTNHIPENFIPAFFDLVVWGHEHECRIDPEYSVVGTGAEGEEQGIFISQPGSSVATSLCEGETKKKHVGILYIKGTTFKMEAVPLQCVRPFVMDSVVLSQTGIHPREEEQIVAYLAEKVRGLVAQANANNPKERLPLIRLKVEYSGDYETFSMARFGQKFVGEVANPRSILHWHRQRKLTSLKRKTSPEPGGLAAVALADAGGEGLSMPALVEQQLQNQKLSLLSEKNLTEALTQFVEKEETEAIADFVKYSLQQTQLYLKDRPISEADIDTQIARQREELVRRQEEGASAAHKEVSQARSAGLVEEGGGAEGEGEVGEGRAGTSGRGRRGSASGSSEAGKRGRGRGRGGRGRGRGSRGGKGKSAATSRESPVVQPGLEFSSASGRSAHKQQSRSSKRIMYEESDSVSEEEEEEVSFIHASSQRKKRPREKETVDLTQSGSDGEGGATSMFSAPPTAVRRKR